MKANEFATICSEHNIAPEIALEDEGVRDILWEISEDRGSFRCGAYRLPRTIEKLNNYLSENF